MYKAILLSIGSPTTLGIYYEETSQKITEYKEPKLIFILRIDGKTSDVLPLLFVSHNLDKENIYKNLESLLTAEVLSKCSLAECLIDSSFLKENEVLSHALKTFDINLSANNRLDSLTQKGIEARGIESNDTHLKEHFFSQYKISLNSTIDSKEQIRFVRLDCNLAKTLYLLSYFMPLNAIYYSRGVGSLSAIKLTHVFLHTLSLSSDIHIYATNSFYFSQANEIKAFANMSFYFDATKADSKHTIITDSNVKDYIYIAPSSIDSSMDTLSLLLPYRLIHNDFLESCTPLYVTPAV